MEKLIKIQSELKAPKGNFNSFGKYKYRSAEDILEAVKPLLLKHNVVVTLSDSIEAIGNKLFLIARASIIEADNSALVSVTGYAELSEHKGMSAEQATGTASSYARKYALNGLFLIDETEADADNQNTQAKNESIEDYKNKLNACTTKDALRAVYLSMPKAIKDQLVEYVKTLSESKA